MQKPKAKPIATKEQMETAIRAILAAPKGQELRGVLEMGDRTVSVDRTDRMAHVMLKALWQEYGDDLTLNEFAQATMALQWWFAELFVVLDQSDLAAQAN